MLSRASPPAAAPPPPPPRSPSPPPPPHPLSATMLCSQVLEADGGYWGCRLPAFHRGPHDVSVPTRRRTPPTPASSCPMGTLARHGAPRDSHHHHLTGKAVSTESASHRLGVPPGVAAKANLTAACVREGEEALARSAGDEPASIPGDCVSGGSGRSHSLALLERRDVAVHAGLRACTGENASACEGATARRDPRWSHTDSSTPRDLACAISEEDDALCPSLSPSHCPAVHARLRACTGESASSSEGSTARNDPQWSHTDTSMPQYSACAFPEEEDAPCPSLSPSHCPAVHARLRACMGESASSCEGDTVRSDPWWTQTHTCTPLTPASGVPEEEDVPCPSLSPSHCPDVPLHALARASTSGTAEGVKWSTGPWTDTDPRRATQTSTVAPAENSSHHSLPPFLTPAVAMHAPRDNYDLQCMSADPRPYSSRVAELPVARNHLLHHPARTPCTSFPSAVAVVTEFALVSPPPSAYISPSPLHPHLTATAPSSSLARSRGLSARPARQPFKQLGLHKVFPPAPFASDDFKPQWQQSSYGCSSWNGVEVSHTLEPLVTARAPEVATPMHAALGVRHKRRFPHHVIGPRTHRMPLPFNEADEQKGPPRFACGSWTFSSDPCKRLRLKLVRSHAPRSEMNISFPHTQFSSEHVAEGAMPAPAAPAPAAPPIKKSHKKKRPPDSDPPTVVAANKVHNQKRPLESASPNLAAPKKSHKKKRPLEAAPPASAPQEKVVPAARSPSEKHPAAVEVTGVGTQSAAPLNAGGDSPPDAQLPEACEWEEQQQRSPTNYGLREHQELVRTSLEEELCSAFASTDTWASAGGGSVQQAAIFQEFLDLDKMNDCEIHSFLSAPEMRSFLFSGDSTHHGSPRRIQSLAGTTPGASQAASTSSAQSIQDDDHVSGEDSMQQQVLDELNAAMMAPSDVATVFESLVALPTD